MLIVVVAQCERGLEDSAFFDCCSPLVYRYFDSDAISILFRARATFHGHEQPVSSHCSSSAIVPHFSQHLWLSIAKCHRPARFYLGRPARHAQQPLFRLL